MTTTLPICPVCLEILAVGLGAIACGHCFHVECIKTWFNRSNQCPSCKTHITKKRITPLFFEAQIGGQNSNEKTGAPADEVSSESCLQHIQQIAALKQCLKQKDLLLGAHNGQIVKLRDEVLAFKGLKEKADTLALGIFEAKKQLSSVERERDQAKEQLEVAKRQTSYTNYAKLFMSNNQEHCDSENGDLESLGNEQFWKKPEHQTVEGLLQLTDIQHKTLETLRKQQRQLISEKKELRGIKQKLQSSEEKIGKDYEELKEHYQRLSQEYKKLRSAHEALQHRYQALSKPGTDNRVPRPAVGSSQDNHRKVLPPERRPSVRDLVSDDIPIQKDTPFTIEKDKSFDGKALANRSNNDFKMAEAKKRTFIKETSNQSINLQCNLLINGAGGELGKKRPMEQPEVKSIKRFLQDAKQNNLPKTFGTRQEGGPHSRMKILNYFQSRQNS